MDLERFGMYTLVLIRHGESTWNLENRFTGWTDVDLTPTGVAQARLAGEMLKAHGFEFDLGYTSVFHPYIFFRAPWFSRKIDYATHETEISSSFGQGHMDINNRCFIRVDPDKTFVFSSCIREHFETNYNYVGNVDAELDKSKKTLSEYLKILEYNAELYKTVYPIFVTKTQPAYHLYTSKLIVFPNNGNFMHTLEYPLSTSPIDMNSEVLVALQHLTPDYFVRCT